MTPLIPSTTKTLRGAALAAALALAGCAPAALPAAELASAPALTQGAALGEERSVELTMKPAADYALQSSSTVHRWVGADVTAYEVELRRSTGPSLSTVEEWVALAPPVVLEVPVTGNGVGQARFAKLRHGQKYRAYVRAKGRRGGANGWGRIIVLNAQATGDWVEFDFTGSNDLRPSLSDTVSVHLDPVPFSGTGTVGFGVPVDGSYTAPQEDISATLVAPNY